ncbi:MAG TPA: ribose 5-phosphate isomerase B [Gemmatimonadota bacterium]|nr:ribose 5-phosphate isomerase B [Gemmatimonadota bacterium]
MASDRTVLLAADHAGFDLKEDLEAHLRDLGWEPLDLGPESAESTDYPDWAHRLAAEIGAGRAARGVLVCGSGTGMSIAANRHSGVRAANCLDEEMAALAREHNDVNVLCLGSRMVDPAGAKRILWTFLETPFGGGRHERRVRKIEPSAA